MPVPVGQVPPDVANYLEALEARIAVLEAPQAPTLLYACLRANLPAAASYINCIAYATDTKIAVVSDGTLWRRQDTGAGI